MGLMNFALWIAQGLLCAAFLMAGFMKVFAFEKYKADAENRSPNRGLGLSKGLVTFIGICELAGAAGVIVPRAVWILPWLTPLAAFGLAIIMVLAAIYHLRRQEQVFVQFILFVLAGFVAVGRILH
ncbi:MAG: DoxX family protein [Candidatus Acidiferrales bacterium]